MYYIVQENVFREENYDNLITGLERLGLPYEIISLEKGVDDVKFETDRKDVFPFGAVKLSRISRKYGWNPGSQLCENHDYEVYSKYYKDNLLNYDSEIVRFGDNFHRDGKFFARPTEDTKVFTGRVFTMEEWEAFKEDSYVNPKSNILNKDTPIQISSVKPIQKEIRFWIIKGQIITASQYTLGGNLCTDSNVDDDAYEFVKEMIKLFELNDTFTMDICLTNSIYKIVECGCISSAGFYKADMNRLLMALEDAFDEEEKSKGATQKMIDILGQSSPPKPMPQYIVDSIKDGSFFNKFNFD